MENKIENQEPMNWPEAIQSIIRDALFMTISICITVVAVTGMVIKWGIPQIEQTIVASINSTKEATMEFSAWSRHSDSVATAIIGSTAKPKPKNPRGFYKPEGRPLNEREDLKVVKKPNGKIFITSAEESISDAE